MLSFPGDFVDFGKKIVICSLPFYLAYLNYKTMAKVNSKGMVSGTAGSVVYRNYRGMNIIQGKPRKFKQTEGSIRAAT